MKCPVCGKEMSAGFQCTYNNVQMCIPCAYHLAPKGSPARKSIEMNYPEVTRYE